MGKIFFTADTHFGHSNIIKYCKRPFLSEVDKQEFDARKGNWDNSPINWRIAKESVEMMDKTLIDNINAIVKEEDTLWHLGDFAFGIKDNYANVVEGYRRRINCKNINIVWGNHDQPWKAKHVFKQNYDLTDIEAPGYRHRIIMCHYAMAVWEGSHRGNWQLYGHSHTTAEPWMDKHMPQRRSVDVGVDNAKLLLGSYRPFSMEDLEKIFLKRDGFSMDHHTSKKEH